MIVTYVVTTLLALLGLSQVVVVVVLRRFIRENMICESDASGRSEANLQTPFEPPVAIILSLRGADPGLEEGLRRLLTQDYEHYQLVVIVDHPSDPAWEVAHRVSREFDAKRVSIQEIRNRSGRCGLKCSALIQAVESLDDSVDIVVFSDADVVVAKDWLRTLIAPLQEATVGLATGAQWFAPSDRSLGSWVRSIWNAGASVPTILLHHPWAGSCAMRRRDLLRSGLLDRWRESIIDDGPMVDAITGLGLKLRFVSNAWMVNRESCSLRFTVRYIQRMLTWSRLYESTYLLTVLHSLLTSISMSLAMLNMATSAVQGNWRSMIVSGMGLGIFLGLSAFGYFGIQYLIRYCARRRGDDVPSTDPLTFGVLILSLPLTYWIYGWAAVTALGVRHVKWRGVEYRLKSCRQVEMTHYQPFQADSTQTGQSI